MERDVKTMKIHSGEKKQKNLGGHELGVKDSGG